ncbi:protein translocase subunit SecF [Candidatus Uhrbacteria bacterium]|nr:protein translocase subunit SecF [Candidatus Uhrbacteria bacterium]
MTFSVTKYRYVSYAFSAVLIIGSCIALAGYGLKQGIEFTGGSLMALRFDERPSSPEVEQVLIDAVPDLGSVIIQPAGDKDIQIRLKALSEDEHQKASTGIKTKWPNVQELRFDAIGPVIGQELRAKSIQGLIIVLIAIMAYVAYAFRKVQAPVQSWKYGLITIFTAFHDTILPLGVFALLGHFAGVEIGTPFVAAILTILGYSITDTIVILDRVRENLGKVDGTFAHIIDISMRQSFLRSFNTSITTLLALVAIYLFGGASLHEFTLALIIGIATGTYSSLFIAAPLLLSVDKFSKRYARN